MDELIASYSRSVLKLLIAVAASGVQTKVKTPPVLFPFGVVKEPLESYSSGWS